MGRGSSGASAKSAGKPKASDFNAPLSKMLSTDLPSITGGSAAEIAEVEKERKDLIKGYMYRATTKNNDGMGPISKELSHIAMSGTQQEKAEYAAKWAEEKSGGHKNLLPQKQKQITDTLNEMNDRGRRAQDIALSLPTSVSWWKGDYHYDMRYSDQLDKYLDGKIDRPNWLKRR